MASCTRDELFCTETRGKIFSTLSEQTMSTGEKKVGWKNSTRETRLEVGHMLQGYSDGKFLYFFLLIVSSLLNLLNPLIISITQSGKS